MQFSYVIYTSPMLLLESLWKARFFTFVQTGAGAHAVYEMVTGSLSQGYSGRGVALTTHSHLEWRLKKEYSPSGLSQLVLRRILTLYLPLFLLERISALSIRHLQRAQTVVY